MRLDIDYIAEILKSAEEHPKAEISHAELLAATNVDTNNVEQVDKHYYHMKRIEELGFFDCAHYGSYPKDGFGFYFTTDGRHLFDTDYELTIYGHQFLEAMQKDTWKEKVKIWFKEMTIEQLKVQLPAMLINLMISGAMK